MALSTRVEESIDEACNHLRIALRHAAVNEPSPVALHLSKALNDLEMLKHSQEMNDKIQDMMKEVGEDGKGFPFPFG